MRRHLLAFSLAAVLPVAPAWAQTLSIEDVPEGIRLDVDDVPVEEAVDALAQRFDFAVKIVRPSDGRLSGSRSGGAQELLNWVLTGHDRAIFVSKVDGRDRVTRVVIYGPVGNSPPPAPPSLESGGEAMDYQEPPSEDFPPEPGMSQEPGEPPLDGGMNDFGDPPLQ